MLPANANTYGAWLVDLDGTLYRPGFVKLAMGAELMLLGWGSIPTLRRFRQEHERLREEERAGAEAPSEAPYRAQLARTAAALGQEVTHVEARVREWMFERPGKWLARTKREALLLAIAQFRGGGGRTALVSDYPAELKLSALAARELFDVVVANGETHGPRRLKPHPEGFLRAAELLGVQPERCLVIGDREDADGAAAAAAGMSFCLIR